MTTGEESFVPEYDLDGNQTRIKTSTGIWTASYNAQNRPVRFTRENADGTSTVITAAYDYLGRRAWKKVETIATDPATGEETATVTLHQRYIYRGYLQVAACELTRGGHPCLWLITWDPTQPIATRPLAIQKDGTWYCYGWDLTKNICEVYGQAGYIRTTYSYSPYGSVTGEGDVAQPLQWSSEYADPELGLVYYNYRYYNPTDGRWTRRDPLGIGGGIDLYAFLQNRTTWAIDFLGRDYLDRFPERFRSWYHRIGKPEYLKKGGKGIPSKNCPKNIKRPSNPDLPPEAIDLLYEEWKRRGCPYGPKGRKKGGWEKTKKLSVEKEIEYEDDISDFYDSNYAIESTDHSSINTYLALAGLGALTVAAAVFPFDGPLGEAAAGSAFLAIWATL